MQANQTAVVWTIILVGIAVLLLGGYGFYSVNNHITSTNDAIKKLPSKTDIIVDVPSAEDIARAVVIPSYDDTEVLVGLYPSKVSALRNDCVHDLQDKYETDEVTEDIQDVIEADIGEEIESVSIINWNYNNDFEFSVFDLGIEDEETRAAEISSTLRVQYKLVDGDGDLIKVRVYAVATCSDWDKRQNEFDNLQVSYSL